MKELASEKVQIVQSQPYQAPKLSRVAREAKAHWGYSEEWLELWREDLSLSPSDIVQSETYCAMILREVVGFYLLSCKRGALWLDHLWILPKYIREGIGTALFAHAIERARESGYTHFFIESDPNAAGFYRRMGARQVEVKTVDLDGRKRELPTFVYDVRERSSDA